MPLKGAQEFIEDLVRYVQPPQGCAISITEREPRRVDGTNWRSAVDVMPLDALSRYDSATTELCRQYPKIDWTGITEFDVEKRRIARWASEV
ncbi:hypothetical protein [Tardiphaga sp. 813_E8_N1_3]|uniref:hypothetical protein n=1 Tax=Tardiphaga sp. 813_E8_N1_3 TaxID=3240760 RepID=UPI003F22E4BA